MLSMNIKDKLKELICYYQTTRCVGHTTGMLEGANYTDKALILTHDTNMANQVKQLIGSPKSVVVNSINSPHMVRGFKRPLFIDNAALMVLFKEALNEIEQLEQRASET